MKYRWIILIIVILIVTGLLIYLLTRKEKKEVIESIKSLYYSYSVGYTANAHYRYEITCEDKCTVMIKPNGYSEEEAKTYELDSKSIDDILNVLNKYEVSKWNGFQKYDQNVLDGDDFDFSLTTKDDKYIRATGYMMWPEHYREVKNELKEIFDNYIKDDFKEERW